MKSIYIVFFYIILSWNISAQEIINCELISTSDTLVNAYRIALNGNKLYTGQDKFYTLDISDVKNPQLVSEMDLGVRFNYIFIKDNLAYVGVYGGLFILDITAPEPIQLSYLEVKSKNDDSFEEVQVIKVHSNFSYLGTLGGSLIVADISDPSNPVKVYHHFEYDHIYDIEIRDTLLYAAAQSVGVVVFNISDPQNPKRLNHITIQNSHDYVQNDWGIDANEIELIDSLLYVCSDLHIFDISNLSSPKKLNYTESEGGACIKVEGDFAYKTSFEDLFIYNISDPKNVELVGHYPLPPYSYYLEVRDKIVYAACQNEGVYIIRFNDITDIDGANSHIYSYNLSQNFPNPFNPSTTINYSIGNPDKVVLKVYNSVGEEIKTLVNDFKSSGNYSVPFDSNNLPSGVYYYRLLTSNFSESKKMILIK